MHPIERLRYVSARVSGADAGVLVQEVASALSGVIRVEPAGLVPACRRLIERHLTVGPVWWLAARVLTAPDPAAAAAMAAAEMAADPTAGLLSAVLSDDATVTVIGWPDVAGEALRRRGDAEALVVEAGGEGRILARQLEDAGTGVVVVPDPGVAAAVVVSDLVLVEATAAGPDGILAALGSHAAAAVAASREVPVWAVTGTARVLPAQLWAALLQRLDAGQAEPWDRPVELVPAAILTSVVGPDGVASVDEGLGQTTCPVAPELLGPARG